MLVGYFEPTMNPILRINYYLSVCHRFALIDLSLE